MPFAGLLSRRLPDTVVDILRPLYRRYSQAKVRASELAYIHGVLAPEDIYSEDYYKKRERDPWRSDSRNVSKSLSERYNPNSVIDFGCAIGNHLEIFHEDGVFVHGIEGNSKAFNHAVVPLNCLEQHDLREPYYTDRTYDLVLCFEVAEHLPEAAADRLVKTLAEAGETVVMTAAPPNQNGTHHINLQPREYWIEKFRRQGMRYDKKAVDHLRALMNIEMTVWIPKNLLVFEHNGS